MNEPCDSRLNAKSKVESRNAPPYLMLCLLAFLHTCPTDMRKLSGDRLRRSEHLSDAFALRLLHLPP